LLDVRFDVARLAAFRFGAARCDDDGLADARPEGERVAPPRLGVARLEVARFGVARFGAARFGVARFDVARFADVRFDAAAPVLRARFFFPPPS
jgi:hypothetical protein